MERIIIIDDKKCEKELSDFLEANKEHIRYNTPLNDVKSTTKGFFEEIISGLGSEDKLAIDSNQQIEIVHTRDITYLETVNQKTHLYLKNNTIIETNGGLNSFMDKLKGSNFLRVHSNYIINLDYFSKLDFKEDPALELSTGIKVPIDPARKSLLLNYLKKLDI